MTDTDIIERLENLTGPDREVDAEIAKACGEPADGFWRHVLFNLFLTDDVPGFSKELTGSLDAALALTERLLPGWQWQVLVSSNRRGEYSGWVHPSDSWASGTGPNAHHGIGKLPAIALLIATLKAKESQSG